MMITRPVCWLILILSSAISLTAAPLPLTDSSGRIALGQWLEYLEDPSHQLRFRDVRSGSFQNRFAVNPQKVPNFGFRNSSFWFRFTIHNRSGDSLWVIEQALRGMGEFDAYTILEDGRITEQRGGDLIHPRVSQMASAGYAFLLPIPKATSATVYLRIRPFAGQAFFPLYLSTLTTYQRHNQLSVLLWGIYYGLLLTGFLYHLLLWSFTRQTGYAYLSLYLIVYFLYEINRGLSPVQQYVWPNADWLIVNGVSLFFTLSLFAFINFYVHAFSFRLAGSREKMSMLLLIGYITCLWLLPFLLPGLSRNLIAIGQFLPTAAFMLLIGFYKLRAGHIYTQFYFYSLVCSIGGGFLFSLNRAGVLPGDDFVVHYTANLGSILEIILMSFGVAFAMQREQKNTVYYSEKAKTAFTEGRAEELNMVALRLHHEAGNNLLILLRAIEQLTPGQPLSQQTIKTLYGQAFESYSMVRNWGHSATPETLLNQGLYSALHKLVDRANQAGSVSFLMLVTGNDERLPLQVQFELYYVCVELVNNVLKHAQATEASLYISIHPHLMTVECRDDGVGFFHTASSPTTGMGLDTIGKRLTRIGGTYETHQLSERGSKVIVRVPLSDQTILSGK